MGLEDKHIQAISILILSDHFIGEAFDFKFLVEIFVQMGLIKDKKVDNKTIRVLNRLKDYMTNLQVRSLQKLLGDLVMIKTIRVKGKHEKQVIFLVS